MSLSPALQKYLARDLWHRSPVLFPAGAIPFSYRDNSFGNRRITPALRAGKLLVEDPELSCRGLVLSGGVGTGKTTACICVARHLIDEGSCERVAYFTFGDFVSRLLNPELRAETLDAAREADVLLIDDLGSSFASRDGFAVALLEEAIIHREASLYSMMITTNIGPAEFRKRFGDRIHDRLRGRWGCWVDVSGPSMRSKRPRT